MLCSNVYKTNVSWLCCVYMRILIIMFHQNNWKKELKIQNMFIINFLKINTTLAN